MHVTAALRPGRALTLVAVGDDVRLLQERIADFAAERLRVDLKAVDLLAVGIVDREFDHVSPRCGFVPAFRLILRVPVLRGTGQESTW